MRRSHPPSRSLAPLPPHVARAPQLGHARSTPALQWLPPASLQGIVTEGGDKKQRGAEEAIAASWMKDLSEQHAFKSSITFIEFQLRQALAATSSTQGPDAFRTACVCECLHRLAQPDAVGTGLSAVLKLMREELLKAIYVDYKPFGRGVRVRSRVQEREGPCRSGFFSSFALDVPPLFFLSRATADRCADLNVPPYAFYRLRRIAHQTISVGGPHF